MINPYYDYVSSETDYPSLNQSGKAWVYGKNTVLHSIVLTGYDQRKNEVYINDPLKAGRVVLNWDQFAKSYFIFGSNQARGGEYYVFRPQVP